MQARNEETSCLLNTQFVASVVSVLRVRDRSPTCCKCHADIQLGFQVAPFLFRGYCFRPACLVEVRHWISNPACWDPKKVDGQIPSWKVFGGTDTSPKKFRLCSAGRESSRLVNLNRKGKRVPVSRPIPRKIPGSIAFALSGTISRAIP